MALFSQVRGLLSVRKLNAQCALTFLFYLLSENAYAAVDLQTALTNLSNIIVPLTGVVLMCSYIGGIMLIFNGLMLMKKFGQVGTATAQPGELGGPLMKIIIGAILIYLPTSTDTFLNSLFSTAGTIFGDGGTTNLQTYQSLGVGASLLGYLGGDTLSQQWQSLANTLVLYIQFLGLLSFVKGWFILSHSVGQGAQQGSFAKGLTHIIGGIIAINFVGVVNIINNSIMGTG